jgi:hypothetical protein
MERVFSLFGQGEAYDFVGHGENVTLCQRALVCSCGEVAVGAARATERNMNVDSSWLHQDVFDYSMRACAFIVRASAYKLLWTGMRRRFFAVYDFMWEIRNEFVRARNFPNNFGKLPVHRRGILLDSVKGQIGWTRALLPRINLVRMFINQVQCKHLTN